MSKTAEDGTESLEKISSCNRATTKLYARYLLDSEVEGTDLSKDAIKYWQPYFPPGSASSYKCTEDDASAKKVLIILITKNTYDCNSSSFDR